MRCIALRAKCRCVKFVLAMTSAKKPLVVLSHNDGLDYVPTDKKVLFGHHFAAIAGAARW